MLYCVAAYKGLYHNTGDCSQKALQKYSRPWIIIYIYKYVKQKLCTPFYENYADGGVWNLTQL